VDFCSVGGIILALASIILTMVVDGGSLMSLLKESAAMVVFGGTLGAVLLQTPLHVFLQAIKMIPWVFFPPKDDRAEQLKNITDWLRIARHQFVLALDPIADQQTDPFIKQGLRLVVDGIDAAQIRIVLESMTATKAHGQMVAAEMFDAMGGYAPTVGILGAVMGLITVMSHLDDPTRLGPGIATAFVATVYGVGLANLFCLPIGNKLKFLINRQVSRFEMITEGMVGIAILESPLQLELRLRSYLEESEVKNSGGEEGGTAPSGARQAEAT
jgi:chemotaxis protein MotA